MYRYKPQNYLKKQLSNLVLHLKQLEKEGQQNPKLKRKKS